MKPEDCPIGLDKVHCQNCYFWQEGKCDYDAIMREHSKNQERIFRISGNNKGLMCPFKPILCQEGYCSECQIYLDWQKRREMLVICAWCSKAISTKPGLGHSGVSDGICPECKQRFPNVIKRRGVVRSET